MKITQAYLKVLATRISQYPEEGYPEFLLVGRSNVGKSSFINFLLERKDLAHTSSKPGKTQTLNFYNVNEQFYLVDVPGYGYAALSSKEQQKFGLMIEEYLEHRDLLKRVFMIVDYKIKPTEDDILMYKYLKYYNIPVTIIANKMDKVPKTKRPKALKLIKDTISLSVGDDLVEVSSLKKIGRDQVLEIIENNIKKEENNEVEEI